MLVDFFADWCGPCKIMAPYLDEVKNKLGDDAHIIKVDVDRNPEAAHHYQVQSVPTLIIFKNGAPVWRQSGVLPPNQLEQQIRRFL